MYSTCYHCLGSLGRNAAVAPFPVGLRLAFDADRGRLWAVCLHCGRWNLAPLDERGEATEWCERLFRAARRRYGTPNVGLAQLADGTELVRIGPALRPELAAWRYGGRLLQTRRPAGHAHVRALAAGVAAVVRTTRRAAGVGGTATPEEAGLRFVLARSGRWSEHVLDVVRTGPRRASGAARDTPTGDTATGDIPVAAIRRRHLAEAVLVRPDRDAPWRLEIPHEQGTVGLSGANGLRTAARLLAAVNAHGVTPDAVAAALRKVEEAADPDGYFNRVLRVAWRSRWGRAASGPLSDASTSHASTPHAPAPHASAPHAPAPAAKLPGTAPPNPPAAAGGADAGRLAVAVTGRAFWARGGVGSPERQLLLRTPLVDRLALEMAAHEDAERAALAETLAALEAAWREAEELARIVDVL